jgi:hypothetical protein
MIDEALIEELNRGYICPADAGPAWRAAHEYGFDMSLVDELLIKKPDERLEAHQRALDMILALNNGLYPLVENEKTRLTDHPNSSPRNHQA